MTDTPRATRLTYAGLFFVALATLMQEILLTRIFSVTMWYHFAFVALSVAMFGMTVGSLIVFLMPRTFTREGVKQQLAWAAIAFPILIVLSFLTQLSIPFIIHPSIVAIYAVVFSYAVISIPFIASGIVISLALTRFPARVSQLYAADLSAAALACLLIIYVLSLTDGPTAVLIVAFLAGLGAVCFARDAGVPVARRTATFVAVLLAIAAGGHSVLVWREFPVLRILYSKGGFEPRPLYEKWNSYSRVRVSGDPEALGPPYQRSLSPLYPSDQLIRQLRMDIDVNASTQLIGYGADPASAEHLKYDVAYLGYYVRPPGDVLVIGVGGGRDVLAALTMGATSVTGVEMNKDIIETITGRFGDFAGHLGRDPRVRFVNDEARSYIARHPGRFDVIQISLIDTWAATAAGAFALSENSLYTIEAWNIFLRHLNQAGVLSVSRWYLEGQPGEMYRSLSLASAALQAIGVKNPRDHLLVVRSHPTGVNDLVGLGTILVSPTPFTPAEIDRFEAATAKFKFEVVLSPRQAIEEPFVRLTSGQDPVAVAETFPMNVAPPTDASPFFFHMLRFRNLDDLRQLAQGKNSPNMVAMLVLGILLLTVVGLSVLCIVVPLWLTSDVAALRGRAPLVAFFAAIGLGFMLVETSQMQRLIIVLGHPTYALSVVLFSLLLSSGIGSYLTRHVTPSAAGRAGRTRLAALVVVLIAFGAITPTVVHTFEGSTTAVRIVAAVVLLFPAGLLMGMAFPLGMKLATDRAESLAAWLWGINGAFSVCASVLAVVIALWWSISAAFWAGCAAYLIALVAFARAAREQPVEVAAPART